MDYSAIDTAVNNPAHLKKMAKLAEGYGLPLDKGFSVVCYPFANTRTGGARGFSLAVAQNGVDLVETDRLTEDPYGFWTRRALKKIVKRAVMATS